MSLTGVLTSCLFSLLVDTVLAKGGGGGGGEGGGGRTRWFGGDSDGSVPWFTLVLAGFGVLGGCINFIRTRQKRAEFWSNVEDARSRHLKDISNGTKRTAVSLGPKMIDLVAGVMTRNQTSQYPGYLAYDLYDVRYEEGGKLFSSTVTLFFKKMQRKEGIPEDHCGDEENPILWKILGHGADADGFFDIVEGCVNGSTGHAYWIERQKRLESEEESRGCDPRLFALSQGKFDFSSNSYKGWWEASNGVSGVYVRFQGKTPIVEAVSVAAPVPPQVPPANYRSIFPATFVHDKVQANETTPLLLV